MFGLVNLTEKSAALGGFDREETGEAARDVENVSSQGRQGGTCLSQLAFHGEGEVLTATSPSDEQQA